METRVLADADAVATEAARLIATEARVAVAAWGRFVLALSGGSTPWVMMRALAEEDVPWGSVHILQVDERVAPAGHPDRNLTHLHESLGHAALTESHLHAMPVEQADLEAAAHSYERTIRQVAGTPPVIDLVHLGLGLDGHTASLVPGDPVLHVTNQDVAVTGVYMGRRRMTLTFRVLNRARRVLWIVTGADKAAMLSRLRATDPSISAGRVHQQRALLLADRAAAGEGG